MSQHVRDALRKMRETGEAWLTLEGQRHRIVPITDADRGGDEWSGWEVICKTKAKGLTVQMIVSRKNTAYRPKALPIGCWLGWKDVLARVVESHPRPA